MPSYEYISGLELQRQATVQGTVDNVESAKVGPALKKGLYTKAINNKKSGAGVGRSPEPKTFFWLLDPAVRSKHIVLAKFHGKIWISDRV